MIVHRTRSTVPRPSEITREEDYLGRRRFLRELGAAGAGVMLLPGCSTLFGQAPPAELPRLPRTPTSGLYPFARNPAYTLDRPLTDEKVAATVNNFYEFTSDKSLVWKLAQGFDTRPWTLEISGLVEKPQTLDIDELVRAMPMEERLYRHRCVEAWAMAVPWTGFPFRALVDRARPLQRARFLRLTSFLRPAQAPGQRTQTWYRWPYYEGLRIEEAVHPLAFLATGIYGHELPVQHGAPIRLVAPWKYGFKSIKSIVRIEFTDRQPATFWNDEAPDEYDFAANVDPDRPHPRWSQASETLIGSGERRPTLLYNGYAQQVAGLYRG